METEQVLKTVTAISDKYAKQSKNRINKYEQKSQKIGLWLNDGIIQKDLPTRTEITDYGSMDIIEHQNVTVEIENQDRIKEDIANIKDYRTKTFLENFAYLKAKREADKQQ